MLLFCRRNSFYIFYGLEVAVVEAVVTVAVVAVSISTSLQIQIVKSLPDSLGDEFIISTNLCSDEFVQATNLCRDELKYSTGLWATKLGATRLQATKSCRRASIP